MAIAAAALVCVLGAPVAYASDLVTSKAGAITIELLSSDAAFSNTLSLVSPPGAVIAASGCSLEPADGLTGVKLVSEKAAVHGCQVILDADASTPGIQAFPAGTTLRFTMCAKVNADTTCDFLWSSNPSDNSDGLEHVHTAVLADRTQLSWEDEPIPVSDNDFNDLVVNVRVDTDDTDGDGLFDDWETSGIDINGDGIIDLDLRALGADSRHKDLFVQADYMDCGVPGSDCAAGDTHGHQPKAATLAAVTQFFASAPVHNPNGIDGIALHVVGNPIPHQSLVHMSDQCVPADPGSGSFDTIKAARFPTNDPHLFAFRYALWAHQQAAASTSSGCAELPGDDLMVSLGGWNLTGPADIDNDGLSDREVGSIQQQAGVFIHELGHTLNLDHGGGDGVNYKPNYLSLMNYFFQMGGIPGSPPQPGLTGQLLFSTGLLGSLDETALSENATLALGNSQSFFFCPDGITEGSIISGFPINWNCDNVTNGTVAADINFDRVCVAPGADGTLETAFAVGDQREDLPTPGPGSVITDGADRTCSTTSAATDLQIRSVSSTQAKILSDFNDWANLQYSFQRTVAFEQGVHSSRANTIEIDYPTFARNVLADLALEVKGPHHATTGSHVAYELTTRNLHPDLARQVLVEDALPAGLSFVSCSASGGGVCGGSGADRTIRYATVPGGGTVSAHLISQLSCALPDGARITDDAVVSALQADADASNNAATTQLVVRNPAPLLGRATPSKPILFPADHKLVNVTIHYEVADNCPGTTCSLSVTSSEPVTGRGDDTAPDWVVLDAHHIKLRAERDGRGHGRTYTIGVTCGDSGGAVSRTSTTVRVPHDDHDH